MLINAQQSLLLVIDIQEKLAPVIENAKLSIHNAWRLSTASITLSVPTLITEQYPEGLGRTVPQLAQLFTQNAFRQKNHFSLVKESGLLEEIKQFSKTQLIICGMETHVCVLQSVIDLIQAGFEVFVVVDACSSRNMPNHQSASNA